jgi:hypothetical protein
MGVIASETDSVHIIRSLLYSHADTKTVGMQNNMHCLYQNQKITWLFTLEFTEIRVPYEKLRGSTTMKNVRSADSLNKVIKKPSSTPQLPINTKTNLLK